MADNYLLHSPPPASKNMQHQTPKATPSQQQHASNFTAKLATGGEREKSATNLPQIVPLNENDRFL